MTTQTFGILASGVARQNAKVDKEIGLRGGLADLGQLRGLHGEGGGPLSRIARRGKVTRERLGRHRRLERTLAWLTRYRRLSVRYERRKSTRRSCTSDTGLSANAAFKDNRKIATLATALFAPE